MVEKKSGRGKSFRHRRLCFRQSPKDLRNIDESIGKIFVHGAIETITNILRQQHLEIPPTIRVTPDMKRKDFDGALVVCPPSAVGSPWLAQV
jgi:putative mRNA 3-end processing factor